MSDQDFQAKLSEGRQEIEARRVLGAAASLRECAVSLADAEIVSQLDALGNGYNYMLQYMLSGASDPGRGAFLDNTLEELRTVADRLDRQQRGKADPALYFSRMRTGSYMHRDAASLLRRYDSLLQQLDKLPAEKQRPLRAEKEQALTDIFNYVWTTFTLKQQEVKQLKETAADEHTDPSLRAQIVTALWLGCLQYFEASRIEALAEIYTRSSDIAVKARALMSLVLALYAAGDRARIAPGLDARFRTMLDAPADRKHINMVVMDIIRTLDTERINRTLREDFLPTMKKMKPKIDKLFKSGVAPGDGEFNPEWEEILSDSGLDKKMQELNELQNEGADLMMFAFSELKKFGFFNEIANWFLPFDPEHTAISQNGADDSSAVSALISVPGVMCDSDKFSFMLSLGRLSESQRKMMFAQLQQQEEALREAVAEQQLSISSEDAIFKRESARYIRDLNRFLKLFRERTQFIDILRPPFSPAEIPWLGHAVTSDAETLRLIGEFYLRREYWHDAETAFTALERLEGADPSLLEKTGYALQQQRKYEEALAQYRKAELFNPDSLWLIKRIAAVSRLVSAYADAVEYYDKALEREPENVNLLMNKANSLVELGRDAEALPIYYKVNYLKPDHLNSARAIAWVEFTQGNTEKSLSYHKTILGNDAADVSDFINAGHAALAAGDIKLAADYYRKGIAGNKKPGEGLKTYLKIMRSDRDTLLASGIDPATISILSDYIISESGKNLP